MKILLDPVYTGRASTCSTSYLAWQLIRDFVARRDDVFFYLMYPKKMDEFEGELDFLNQMPDRVTLIPYEANHLDRMAELHHIPREMKELLSPIGSEHCDFDFVVTSRIPVLPMMRVLSGRQMGFRAGSMRGFFGLEEMPILSFRDTVAWGDVMEQQTMTSYLLSDGILMNNLWTERSLMQVARKYLSPANQKALREKVHEVVPTELQRLTCEKSYSDGDDFMVGFTGRITATRSFDKVAEQFRKQFAYPLGKNKKHMKFMISTNSKDFGAHREDDIEDIADVQFNGRDAFHEALGKMHVVLNLSDVEDFSLSTYETMLHGVPVIVYNKGWNEFLGKDYPFRVQNEVECYALLKAFAADYATQYEKFKEWESIVWAGLVAGPKNWTTARCLWTLIEEFDKARTEYVVGGGLGGSYIEIADQIAALDTPTINYLEFMADIGKIVQRKNAMLMRSPNPLMMKELLRARGFSDHQAPSVMARPAKPAVKKGAKKQAK